MMWNKNISILILTCLCLLLQACGSPIETRYKKSPDSDFIVIMKEKVRSIGTNHHWISIGSSWVLQESDATQVFYGDGDFPIVYWSSANTVVIAYCQDSVHELLPEYVGKQGMKIYIQVITAPGIIVNGQHLCGTSPEEAWTEKEIQENRKIRAYWNEKQPWILVKQEPK